MCYLLVTALEEPFSPSARGRSNRHLEDPGRNEKQEGIPGVKGKRVAEGAKGAFSRLHGAWCSIGGLK